MSRRHATTLNYTVDEVPSIRRRLVLGALGGGALAIALRAGYLQLVIDEQLKAMGDARHLARIPLRAHRGAILDRRGEPLALSAPTAMLWAIPEKLLDLDEQVIVDIAGLLERNPGEFQQYLRSRKNQNALATLTDVRGLRQLNPEISSAIQNLGGKALRNENHFMRFYPAAEVCGQLVGFCDLEGRGKAGIEAAQNERLEGQDGSLRVRRDARGRVVDTEDDEVVPARNGSDVNLTIDLRLQYLAHRELKASVERHGAKGGMMVIADVQSGDILALVGQPDFDPNVLNDRTREGVRARPIVDSFEPGSTVKPLLVAQALELGAFDATSRIDAAPGYYRVSSHTVRDERNYGVVSLERLLTKSSNVGAVKVGQALGARAVYDGYARFGLNEAAYVNFPGASRPAMRDPSQWRELDLATASYGYGLSVNGLNMLRAYCGLANDGLMPQLRLLADDPLAPPVRAISAATARSVRAMMRSVISAEGTASRAAIRGYDVAGKTGTVHKVSDEGRGYAEHRYQSAFIGMVPAARPRLVALVMIDEPDRSQYFGGLVAAPVFSVVMQGALRLLQIAPDSDAQLPADGMPRHMAAASGGTG